MTKGTAWKRTREREGKGEAGQRQGQKLRTFYQTEGLAAEEGMATGWVLSPGLT